MACEPKNRGKNASKKESQKMKVLIVDDSRAMRAIIQRTLRQAGFNIQIKVVEATNGREVLEKVAKESPDLILSDWNMPEMNGLEFLQALRRDGNETIFGFVTSLATPAMQREATSSGASFYITKPFREQIFKSVLEPYFNG